MRAWLAFWLQWLSFKLYPPTAALIVHGEEAIESVAGALEEPMQSIPDGGEYPEMRR